MTMHQQAQGYKPSTDSAYGPEPRTGSSLGAISLVGTPPTAPPMVYGSFGSYNAPVAYPTLGGDRGDRVIPPPETRPRWLGPASFPAAPAAYPAPAPQAQWPAPSPPTRADSVADMRDPASTDGLRLVVLPRACLPRFLSIAALNTAANRETCGLLLGKPRGAKYVVTTLLIPRQRSTSDTCAMEEEELVLQFTEERNLITLGWIHTHPTQSCFMSSLDLHTHAGFQRMLPESFAVVCSPLHQPKYVRQRTLLFLRHA
jgi:STAM-binding protein